MDVNMSDPSTYPDITSNGSWWAEHFPNGTPGAPSAATQDQGQAGSGGGDPYANNPGGDPSLYANGNSYGLQSQGGGSGSLMDRPNPNAPNNSTGYGSQGQVAANNAGGGGGGSMGMGGGSSGSSGGFYAPGQGLQQYPGMTPDPFLSPTSGGSSQRSNGTGGSQALGSTIQGTPSVSQTGGGFNPTGPNNPFNQAQPWNGGPQSFASQTGYNSGQNAQGAQPSLTMSGFQSGQADMGGAMNGAGFQQGGIGGPQTQAYNQYQGMLSDPTSMSANPAYKAIMDAATQATQRQGLARGGNGGGTIEAELAKTGASVAGQYLPQMASMYQQGAQQEIGNWNTQNQANLGAGQLGEGIYGAQNQSNIGYGNLGSNLYGQTSQANLGAGNLANNMYSNAANNQFNLGNAYGQMQNGAANTQGASLAQAQMQPANQYFQNQLTMQNQGY